jgi:hypothetical protein
MVLSTEDEALTDITRQQFAFFHNVVLLKSCDPIHV